VNEKNLAHRVCCTKNNKETSTEREMFTLVPVDWKKLLRLGRQIVTFKMLVYRLAAITCIHYLTGEYMCTGKKYPYIKMLARSYISSSYKLL
jgi:hypothetical protein